MRHGMALALLFTGIGYFLGAGTRCVPMIPDLLKPILLGGTALLIPAMTYRRLGLPDLQRAAGVAPAVMFSLLVIVNIDLVIKDTGVESLGFGQTYFVLRRFLQPLFIGWALYSVGIDPWP